jgi:hypothetical protein
MGDLHAFGCGTTILTGLLLYWTWFGARGRGGASFVPVESLLLVGALAGVV